MTLKWRRFHVEALLLMAALMNSPAMAGNDVTALPGIKNYSQTGSPSSYAGSPVGFGGATHPAAMAVLKNDGYATVINLRFPTEAGADIEGSRAAAEAVGLNYVSMPFTPAELNDGYLERFWTVIGDSANQPVYIHCASATRVAALWMITRVQKDGWTINDATVEAEAIAAKPEDAVAVASQYLSRVRK